MVSRRTLLILSAVVSLAFHVGVIKLSEQMDVKRMPWVRPAPSQVFRVQLKEVPPLPLPSETAALQGGALASRPGSVDDLLKRTIQQLKPEESLLSKSADLPQLAERVAGDTLQREHDLAPDPALLAKADAKIIEISETQARQDIQIPRRLVQPSSTRILAENEFPTIRDPEEHPDDVLMFQPKSADFGTALMSAAAGGVPAGSENSAVPPLEPIAELPKTIDTSLPAFPGPGVGESTAKEIAKEKKFEFMDDMVDAHLDTFVPPDGNKGYFRLTLAPKKDKEIEVLNKDVTFVIDASQSILQRKLDDASEALKGMINLLHPEDRFNVIIFRDTPNPFRPTSVPASAENKTAAMAFVTGLKASGETDVYRAIRSAVVEAPLTGSPSMVVLITDGRPTTGLLDARTIINDLTDDNLQRKPVYAYGGGNTVNGYLLDLLAYRNKGEAHVTENLNSFRQDMLKQFARISDPILVDCRADFGGIEKGQVFPREISDFYRGRAVTVYGRFDAKSDNDFVMRLTGRAGARKKEVIFKTDLTTARSGDAMIAHDWAFQRIYFLIGEICRVGEKPELLAEIRRLSSTYGIKTSYSQ